MELHQLRSFVALADLGGIASVSEKLSLSPPAIHKQLKLLEAELGVQLYEKCGRSLRLTQAAELLLPYCRNLLAEHDTAVAAIREWQGLKRGIIRIGAGPATSVHLLPGLLRTYRRAFPEIDIVVETGNSVSLIEQLRTGSLDLALLVSSQQPVDPSLSVEGTWDMEFVFLSNLEHAPRRCRVSELRKFPFILFRKGSRMQDAIDRYFSELDFHPRVIMAFDNADAIKAMIGAGLGVSLLPFWIVHADLRQRALTVIRQRERSLFAKFELVRRASNYVPTPVAAFIDLARSYRFASLRSEASAAVAPRATHPSSVR
jgi:DNA-binding transcriptional LysR family regulator